MTARPVLDAGHLRIARRLAMMVGGEAVQSGFHFALNIVLVRALPAHDYGVFALTMVAGGLGLTYIRSLTAMPASIRIGRSQSPRTARMQDVTFGSAALALSGLIGAATAALLSIWLATEGAVFGGAFAGLWSLRSHLRTASFALGRRRQASASDVAFTLAGVAFVAAALLSGGDLLPRVLLAMAGANALGIAVMLALAGRRPRVSFNAGVRRRYGQLWPQLAWSGLGVTTTNLQGQGIALLVTAMAGPAAYAPIAAILVLVTPLRVGATALVNMVQPDVSALLARGQTDVAWRRCLTWSALAGLAGLAYGAVMLAVLPRVHWQALAGAPVGELGLFRWTIYTVTLLYVMPRVVLEVAMAFRTVALITAAGAAAGLGLIAAILLVAPPPWALAGSAASEAVVLAASWAAARRRLAPPATERTVVPFSGLAAPASPFAPHQVEETLR